VKSGFDKVIHVGMYAVLSLSLILKSHPKNHFVARPFNETYSPNPRADFWLKIRIVLFVLSILGLYAGLDEASQPLVGRDGSWEDWVADIYGIISGWLVFLWLQKNAVRQNKGIHNP